MKIELYNKHPKYNEYFYTELEMPASRYAIHDALQKIRFFKGDTLEFNISECNEFPEINGKNVDRANIFDLNRFARSLENMEEYQLVTMRAVFIRRQNEGTYRDGIMMGELINLAYGLNSLPSVKGINNIHELGEFVMENEMNPLLEDLKAETLDLIDRNALGVNQVNTDNGIFIDGYYVATSGYEISKSLFEVAKSLMADGILTARGNKKWTSKGIESILKNEKYKGDALLQKTYIVDCISKKCKKNNGELPMYYVENNHPAIIDRATFDRVQEEISRRNSKPKKTEKRTKTELGKYSSKYALTELLYCGCCGKPYRRVTWTIRGKKKIVWRCISRLDYGKKYCKDSPSVEETLLHNAITEAITQNAQNEGVQTETICEHIRMYQQSLDTSTLIAKQKRLKELEQRIEDLANMNSEAAQNGDFDEQFEALFTEMYTLKDELAEINKQQSKINQNPKTLNEISTILEGLKNHPVEYNDQAVRQLIQYIKVLSKTEVEIHFKNGENTRISL